MIKQDGNEAAASTVEPVAWRTRNDYGNWCITQNGALAATWRDIEKLTVEPLYAAPTTSPEPDAVRESP